MTKVVIIDENKRICTNVVYHTGAEHRQLADRAMKEALEQAGLSFNEISYVIATGYGRISVPFADHQITELSCHTRGLFHFFPDVALAIDIGGQDAKALKINKGKLVDFAMNDKCAAGTGRYLEIIADTLNLKLSDLGGISLKSTQNISISSICTVFAQQEIISLFSKGVSLEDIVAAIHDAIAGRVSKMVSRFRSDQEVVLFTGGVAKNIGVVKALEKNLHCTILVPDEPMLTGAIGAALLGMEIIQKKLDHGVVLEKVERSLEGATFFGIEDRN
jgi:predicted CoA-substrate-specific enzyme activase